MAIYLQGNNGSIQLTAPKTTGGSVDLSNYYTKAQTDEKFVTQEDWETIIPTFLTNIPDEYITETELDEKGYATKAEIPDTSNFVTAQYVQVAINENAPDLSAYQTAEQVNTLISNALAEIGVAEDGAY